jgi:sodium-independent sulfate anion transporter 11
MGNRRYTLFMNCISNLIDLIAGLTVGVVVVPQSMSYAKIATLPVQYGLYSSFVGVFIYCFFATSKDVTIGPVAVMSLQTAHVITSIQAAYPNEWSAELIATTLAFFCGVITLGLGIFRLGFIVEFHPCPSYCGFHDWFRNHHRGWSSPFPARHE